MSYRISSQEIRNYAYLEHGEEKDTTIIQDIYMNIFREKIHGLLVHG